MAMKMQQFYALPKFGPEKCPVYLRLPWLNLRIMKTKKKMSRLRISPFFLPKIRLRPKKKGLRLDLVWFLAQT